MVYPLLEYNANDKDSASQSLWGHCSTTTSQKNKWNQWGKLQTVNKREWFRLRGLPKTSPYRWLITRSSCLCYSCTGIPCGPINMSSWVKYWGAERKEMCHLCRTCVEKLMVPDYTLVCSAPGAGPRVLLMGMVGRILSLDSEMIWGRK